MSGPILTDWSSSQKADTAVVDRTRAERAAQGLPLHLSAAQLTSIARAVARRSGPVRGAA